MSLLIFHFKICECRFGYAVVDKINKMFSYLINVVLLFKEC